MALFCNASFAATNTETRLTTNTASQYNPAIYGDKVVWSDNRYGWDIFMKDLTTNTETRLTTNTADQFSPAIYGDKVVWEDYRYGNLDIFMIEV